MRETYFIFELRTCEQLVFRSNKYHNALLLNNVALAVDCLHCLLSPSYRLKPDFAACERIQFQFAINEDDKMSTRAPCRAAPHRAATRKPIPTATRGRKRQRNFLFKFVKRAAMIHDCQVGGRRIFTLYPVFHPVEKFPVRKTVVCNANVACLLP